MDNIENDENSSIISNQPGENILNESRNLNRNINEVSGFSPPFKLVVKIILFLVFIVVSLFAVVYTTEKISDVTYDYVDFAVDKCINYVGGYMEDVLSDLGRLVYNQRADTYYQDKIRILEEINEDIKNYEIKKREDSTNNTHKNETVEQYLDGTTPNYSLATVNDTQNETQENSNYDFKYNIEYEFVKNVTLFAYKGKWTDLKLENNIFENDSGKAELEIVKNYTYPFRNNFISNIESIQSLHMTSYLRDGEYRDNYLNLNLTIKFPANFSYQIDAISKNDFALTANTNSKNNFVQQKLQLVLQNATVEFVVGQIFSESNRTVCQESEVSIEFIRDDKLYVKSFDNQIMISYPQINLSIRDKSCKFSVDMTFDVDVYENYEDRIWNYSLIMTSISIIEIYLTLKLLYEVSDNDQIGKNICLITLSMNIMWNSFICTIHFYLSITNEDFSYEYGTPSMTYFLLFSIFELRLIFFAWRARYHHLVHTNMPLYRRKLLTFYSLFYVFLFVGLLSLRYVLYNFWTCLLFFAATWFFQILHSVLNGTKPPFSMKYIFLLSLGKLFAPMYIKACPYNIFELRPAIWKMFIVCAVILIEIGILALQKLVGPKFLIPSCLKKMPYNYYQDIDQEDKTKNTECVICLDVFSGNETIPRSSNDSGSAQLSSNYRSIYSLYHKITTKFTVWLESLKYTYNKKRLMVTPCNHVFHSPCMEKWMEHKNECPYCRRAIPPLE